MHSNGEEEKGEEEEHEEERKQERKEERKKVKEGDRRVEEERNMRKGVPIAGGVY